MSGLSRELHALANNIANASTHGFRKEGVIFSEFVQSVDGGPSVSMAAGRTRLTSHAQGAVGQTGATFDLAIEGDGFFLLETPEGEALTRNGAFLPNAAGELVNSEGYRVLDAGGAPIFVPPDAGEIAIARDGTVSVGGAPIGQIGLWAPARP
jgi:flagellar basal-body rod protein FlgF